MKVLMIVTEKLPVPPVRGGAIQTYVSAVAPILGRVHRLTVLGVSDPSLPKRETVDGVRYVRIPGGDLESYRRRVAAFLKKNTFDLIHIFNRPRLVRRVRKYAPDARLILSLHNDMFDRLKIKRGDGKKAVAELERVVTVSDYVGRRAEKLYPPVADKRKTIYAGVDLDRFQPIWSSAARRAARALRKQHGLEGKKVILFVGRLSPKKGADILVRSLWHLAQRHPDAALVLVGSKWYGEDRISDYVAYVRALAARAPLPVVTTGFVPADQVHRWFAVGDVFVCASQWQEPLARVHYEAMAAGLPIVTTARGGNPEVIAGTGCGVVLDRPDDPRAMASAIDELLSDRRRRERMGKIGRRLAEEHYTWERVARDILSVWEAADGKERP